MCRIDLQQILVGQQMNLLHGLAYLQNPLALLVTAVCQLFEGVCHPFDTRGQIRHEPPCLLNHHRPFVDLADGIFDQCANFPCRFAVGRYLATQPAEQALTLLETFPANQKKYLATVRRALQVARLQDQATQAEQARHTGQAIDLLTQAQALDSADPWLSFRLASLLLQTGQRDQALAAYDRHLAQHADEPASRYAQALLLESADAWNQALAALSAIDPAAWTDDMVALADRVRTRERIAQAAELFDQGQPLAAIAALEHPPENTHGRCQPACARTGHDPTQQ